MTDALFVFTQQYENWICLAGLSVFILAFLQLYNNLRSNEFSRFQINVFTLLINLICAFASIFIVKYAFLAFLKTFTDYCFTYGKASLMLIYTIFLWLSIFGGHFFSRIFFRKFNFGFQRGKRLISIFASFYLPTFIGILFLIVTDCLEKPWFSWQAYSKFGVFVFLLPYLAAIFFQVGLTTQFIDKKKKVRVQ